MEAQKTIQEVASQVLAELQKQKVDAHIVSVKVGSKSTLWHTVGSGHGGDALEGLLRYADLERDRQGGRSVAKFDCMLTIVWLLKSRDRMTAEERIALVRASRFAQKAGYPFTVVLTGALQKIEYYSPGNQDGDDGGSGQTLVSRACRGSLCEPPPSR